MAEPQDDDTFVADELFEPTQQRSLRRLPTLLATATTIARDAAPREFAATTSLQFVLAVAAAASGVRRPRTTRRAASARRRRDGWRNRSVALRLRRHRCASLLLHHAAGRTSTADGRTRFASYTTGEVLDIAASADLLDYETPSFYNRLQRARINAEARPPQMVGGLLTVGGSLMAIVAVAVALVVVAPLLLVLILVAYVPLWFALLRVSRAEYRFAVAQTERDRRRMHFFDVLSRRQEAAELRAFGHADFIRGAYDELYDARIDDVRQLVRRRSRLGLLGALGNAVLTGLVMVTLVWMATSDQLSTADAGAAAAALLLIAQRLSAVAGGSGMLYESALFMEDYTTFIDAQPPERTRFLWFVARDRVRRDRRAMCGVRLSEPKRIGGAQRDA